MDVSVWFMRGVGVSNTDSHGYRTKDQVRLNVAMAIDGNSIRMIIFKLIQSAHVVVGASLRL